MLIFVVDCCSVPVLDSHWLRRYPVGGIVVSTEFFLFFFCAVQLKLRWDSQVSAWLIVQFLRMLRVMNFAQLVLQVNIRLKTLWRLNLYFFRLYRIDFHVVESSLVCLTDFLDRIWFNWLVKLLKLCMVEHWGIMQWCLCLIWIFRPIKSLGCALLNKIDFGALTGRFDNVLSRCLLNIGDRVLLGQNQQVLLFYNRVGFHYKLVHLIFEFALPAVLRWISVQANTFWLLNAVQFF